MIAQIISKLELPKKGAEILNAGILYKITKSSVSQGTVEYVMPNKKTSSVIIPATVNLDGVTYKVTSIADNAFKNNTEMTTLVIGKNIVRIGKSSFENCKKLKKVTIGKKVIKIGKKAFYKCSNLKTLTIGKDVISISDSAFEKCTALTFVTIPSKVTTIGKRSFYGCKKLSKIVIKSKKLKTIGDNAIKGIYKKAVLKTYKGKLNQYKKIFTYRKGFTKTMKFKQKK